jgi:hypothetical protein
MAHDTATIGHSNRSHYTTQSVGFASRKSVTICQEGYSQLVPHAYTWYTTGQHKGL